MKASEQRAHLALGQPSLPAHLDVVLAEPRSRLQHLGARGNEEEGGGRRRRRRRLLQQGQLTQQLAQQQHA